MREAGRSQISSKTGKCMAKLPSVYTVTLLIVCQEKSSIHWQSHNSGISSILTFNILLHNSVCQNVMVSQL